MSECLNVIALISGGKDSFFSLLHCLQNGHQVIALGNLYPVSEEKSNYGIQCDLNSFMYQTVGHMIIPHYEEVLGIPLYRQRIVGNDNDTGITYRENGDGCDQQDETESLAVLLRQIMTKHPTANAVSTGAIFSTYQRTRIEAVTSRLGLISLAYLWQYPVLRPGSSLSLLEDMSSVGLDARLIKIASAGLNEGFLWQNVASQRTMLQVKSAIKRFSDEADGAVLGEGGEYETLVIDGPSHLFRGRIEVVDACQSIVREGGGSAWLHLSDANVVMKDGELAYNPIPLPPILDTDFKLVVESLKDEETQGNPIAQSTKRHSQQKIYPIPGRQGQLLKWTFTSRPAPTIADEITNVVDQIILELNKTGLESTCIITTMILLRSMRDFATINQIYAKIFPKPNPPARVTIACGASLPSEVNMKIHLTLLSPLATQPKKALHVQSCSYWAPANIGPYSQATTVNIPSVDGELAAVLVAGQIPLIPSTMQLPTAPSMQNMAFYCTLSLQHLWRIGKATQVHWWTSIVAYLPCANTSPSNNLERVMVASRAWTQIHVISSKKHEDESEETVGRDLWEEKYHAQLGGPCQTQRIQHHLPDWSRVRELGIAHAPNTHDHLPIPPLFAVEVHELPKNAPIEWHAQIGLVSPSHSIHLCRHTTPDWAIDQCVFGTHMQVVIAIRFTLDTALVQSHLHAAQSFLAWRLEAAKGVDEGSGATVYQLDSLARIEHQRCDFVVPCRNLWDMAGERLALILMYNTL